MSDTDKVFALVHEKRQKNINRKHGLETETLTMSRVTLFWISSPPDQYLSPVLHSLFHLHSRNSEE